jgi:uncharacterized protein YjbI with pentapeptide repeats
VTYQDEPTDELVDPPCPNANPSAPVTPDGLRTILARHALWLENPANGQRAVLDGAILTDPALAPILRETSLSKASLEQADLTGVDLHGADLRGASLRRASLTGADLSGADLSGADLWGAVLRDAKLSGATLCLTQFVDCALHGAVFYGADAREALFTGAGGVTQTQFAGADLRYATLPDPVANFSLLDHLKELTTSAGRAFIGLLTVCAFVLRTVFGTPDAAFYRDGDTVSIPLLGTSFSTIPARVFFFIAPLLVIGACAYFQSELKRLWSEIGSLPAFFPDGRSLEQRVQPWFLNRVITAHSANIAVRNGVGAVERAAIPLLAWGIVPVTALCIWARILPLHNPLLMFGWYLPMVALSAGIAAATFGSALSTLQRGVRAGRQQELAKMPLLSRAPVPLALSVYAVLAVVAVVLLQAIPAYGSWYRGGAAPAEGWLRSYLSPDLSKAAVSVRPDGWSASQDPTYSLIIGARLQGVDLHYAKCERTFLPRADLSSANLDGADLSNADLHYADLSNCSLHANLSGAHMEHVILRGVDFHHLSGRLLGMKKDVPLSARDLSAIDLSDIHLDQTDLDGIDFSNLNMLQADLTGSYLKAANLSGTTLEDAKLPDADLSDVYGAGANLQGADLKRDDCEGTVFKGADLERADLAHAKVSGTPNRMADWSGAQMSEIDLSDVEMERVNLERADMSSADLKRAHLEECDLSGVDLSNANLGHAVFTHTVFGTASLDGADLTGADLRGVDLTHVTGLSRQQLRSALTDSATRIDARRLIDVTPAAPRRGARRPLR